MKIRRFTESQMVFALKQSETGIKVKEEYVERKKNRWLGHHGASRLDKQILHDVLKKIYQADS